MPTVQSMNNQQEIETLASNDQQLSESNNIEISSDFQVSVTRTTFDTSSPSGDATMQDTIISPDTESFQSRHLSPEHKQKFENRIKTDTSRGSCSNSIISTDSTISDTLDFKNYMIRNSESEIGKCIDKSSDNYKKNL